MSDETNTYGEDIHLTTIDSSTIYTELITALEKGAGEPLYPGDERRIYGEALVAVFVALYNKLDDVGRQTLLRYARGEVLDAIGERLGVKRLEGDTAKTVMRFSLSTPRETNIIIPKWTKVTPDGENYFATDEIAVLQAGTYSVEIPTSAVGNGVKFNGYAAGTITTLVDLIPYIESVTNLTETAGGDDGEPYTEAGDNRLRERIRLAPAKRSTAGPELAYIYWAMTADSSIIDVKAVSETETISGTLTVYNGHAFKGGHAADRHPDRQGPRRKRRGREGRRLRDRLHGRPTHHRSQGQPRRCREHRHRDHTNPRGLREDRAAAEGRQDAGQRHAEQGAGGGQRKGHAPHDRQGAGCGSDYRAL